MDEAGAHRIGDEYKNDRHSPGCLEHRRQTRAANTKNDVRRKRSQFRCVFTRVGGIACGGKAGFDVHVATVGPAQSLQRLLERGEAKPVFRIVPGAWLEHADAPHAFGLLRTPRNWPSSRRGETPYKVASPHGRGP